MARYSSMDRPPDMRFQLGCVTLFLIFVTLCVMPIVMIDVMRTALSRLHLSTELGGVIVVGIFLGSLINIPVHRIERSEPQPELSWGPLSVWMVQPRMTLVRRETIIALNVGGCIIPTLVAVWQMIHLFQTDARTLAAMLGVAALNCLVCSRIARPVKGVGIMMPGFIPPLVSVGATWLLLPSDSPDMASVAFVAGVLGPLIGADIFHLKDISSMTTGMLSIGGAGTFDGIVLSGVLAALLI